MTLIKSPEVQEYDMSSLEWLMPAAAPCKEELTKAVEKLFPGMAVCQCERAEPVQFTDEGDISPTNYLFASSQIA